MKTEKTHSKANRKKKIKTWTIRILAILLIAFMLVGSCYYTIWALFA